MSNNPFPDSAEKQHLRRLHLQSLDKYKSLMGESYSYFGLPSAEMLDVKMWRDFLAHITAVERDNHLTLKMIQTSMFLGLRDRFDVLEGGLLELVRLLAMDNDTAALAIGKLPYNEQQKIHRIRNIYHNLINLDLCGGFLYPKNDGNSDNTETLRYLIKWQEKHKKPFLLILTFNLRDTGSDNYILFIEEALKQLNKANIDTKELEDYYLNPHEYENQPPQLRRLRFCVPVFLHKIAFNNFQARSLGAWYYKTFYHCCVLFEPRKSTGGILGIAWPPIDEIRELLNSPLKRLYVEGTVKSVDLSGPTILEK